MISIRVLFVALALLAHPATSGIAAQSGFQGRIGVTGAVISLERKTTATTQDASGTAVGLEGAVRYWRVELSGRYVQGGVDTDPATDLGDFVEGELLLGVRPIRQILLRIGPHVRSWVEPTGTIRWSHWEVRARGEVPLLAEGSLRSFFEGWFALSGNVNAPSPFQLGRGLEGGVGFTIPSTPLDVQLAYRLDRGALESDARTETVEQLTVRIGVGR